MKWLSVVGPVCVEAAVQSLDLFGRIERESSPIIPENIRASCYQGLISEITTTCTMQASRGALQDNPDGWRYDLPQQYYEQSQGVSDILCLQCCSNTAYDAVAEPIDEAWELDCAIGSEEIRSVLIGSLYGYEFRFARNKNAEDTGIVRCALGRIGCTYEAPAESRAEAPYTSDGRDLACTSGKKNDDFGSCDDSKSVCTCAIPGSQRGGAREHPDNIADLNYLDGIRQREDTFSCTRAKVKGRENGTNLYLKGYELTVEVEEMRNNDGDYWRSVTGCSVQTEEWSAISLDDTFYQRIRMVGRPRRRDYRWLARGTPFVVAFSAFALLVFALVVRCVRDEPCPTCRCKLIFSREQCIMCLAYAAPMPDPVLLARIKARNRALQGGGFAQYVASTFSPTTRRCCRALQLAADLLLRLARCLARCSARLAAFLLRKAAEWLVRVLRWLSRTKKPAAVYAVTIIDDDDDDDDDDEPKKVPVTVPTKIYVADPQLRCENVFGPLTRPVQEREHELIGVPLFADEVDDPIVDDLKSYSSDDDDDDVDVVDLDANKRPDVLATRPSPPRGAATRL